MLIFQFINGQPRTQRVTDEFLWAQWDSQHQRLYLVYPEHKVLQLLYLAFKPFYLKVEKEGLKAKDCFDGNIC